MLKRPRVQRVRGLNVYTTERIEGETVARAVDGRSIGENPGKSVVLATLQTGGMRAVRITLRKLRKNSSLSTVEFEV